MWRRLLDLEYDPAVKMTAVFGCFINSVSLYYGPDHGLLRICKFGEIVFVKLCKLQKSPKSIWLEPRTVGVGEGSLIQTV